MKRMIISAVLFVALLLGGIGCMKNNPAQNTQQDINDIALAYMEQKYGEKFEYAAPYGDSMSGTYELLTTCASLPDQKILVQIENFKREDKEYRDNFIAVKYLQETIGFLNDCIAKGFVEANLLYEVNANGLSSDLSANATFDEYLADDRVPLVIMIEVKASDYSRDEQIEAVIENISLCAARFVLTVIVSEDTSYPSKDRNEISARAANRNLVRGARAQKVDGIVQLEWLEGR